MKEVPVKFTSSMIAPCGINCGTCLAFLRDRNKCCGCLQDSGSKANHCARCRIKNCELLIRTKSKLCYDCEVFPCQRIKQIDKRYRIRYKTDLIQNLLTIKEIGMSNYLASEINKWTCPDCGSTLSVHRDNCLICNYEINKKAS